MRTLYLEDGYLQEFDATVEWANSDRIILDRTAFYPQSGGQPSDTGFLLKDEQEFNVLRVEAPGPTHIVDRMGLGEGDSVHGVIDWGRRYRLMRSHTACHILSAVIFQETGAKITGNQIDLTRSRIDFSIDLFDKAKMAEYVDQANKIIKDDHRVETTIMPKAEALSIPDLVRLAMEILDREEIRVVRVEGADAQACGGTHVRSTIEVGGIKLIKAENKGKANRKVYFELVDGD
jgi:misacylated tRNA(Ala) deacylase